MKPILFSKPMIQAILDGRKSQTRRVVKIPDGYDCTADINPCLVQDNIIPFIGEPNNIKYAYPRYQVGDILYVRETWAITPDSLCLYRGNYRDGTFKDIPSETLIYRADFINDEPTTPNIKWKPNIHMKKEASRIFLKVTDVRVERLQNISDYDAIKEGLGAHLRPREAFVDLWDSINAKRNTGIYAWKHNPWVWVYSFEHYEKSCADGYIVPVKAVTTWQKKKCNSLSML